MKREAKLYSEGKVVLERAAMEADVSVGEIMEYVKDKKVAAQYALEDLEEDMKSFYRRVGK